MLEEHLVLLAAAPTHDAAALAVYLPLPQEEGQEEQDE